MDGSHPAISVVVPSLNEETTIAECITRIRQVFAALGVEGEIIVADSSRDRTPEIAVSLGAKVVRPERMGYGNAYLAGLARARGTYVVIGDADNTYDFLEIPRLLAPLEDGADLVLGSRLDGTILPGAMPPLHRYIGNPLLTRLLNLVFGTHISDAHTGFRAIRRDSLECLHLKTGGMEFASEMIIEAALAGLCIEEVPITYHPRHAPSKLQSLSDGWRHVRFMLLYRPVPFLAVPGLFFAFFGLSLMLLFLMGGDGETYRLHSFILAALAFVGGLEGMLMGFIIRVFSVVHGYGRQSAMVSRLLDYNLLEWGIAGGGLMMAAGLVVGLGIVYQWAAAGFGSLSQIANAVWALALFLAGIQILFAAIFVSMILLRADQDNA